MSILPSKGEQSHEEELQRVQKRMAELGGQDLHHDLRLPILLVRKYEWLEKERSNWLVQVMGVDLSPSITRKLRPL